MLKVVMKNYEGIDKIISNLLYCWQIVKLKDFIYFTETRKSSWESIELSWIVILIIISYFNTLVSSEKAILFLE